MAGPVVHLAHDWLVGLRGGELVLDRLARLYGPTTLYTLVNDGRPLTPAIDACDVRASFLQRLPGAAGSWRRRYLPLMPLAVSRLKTEPCDLLISTSSAVMKSIHPPPASASTSGGGRVPHLCYCHSPARYIWGQADDYAVGAGGRARRLGLGLISRPFRVWDRRTADRVTRFLANSRHTARKVERFYNRNADVVHPPVRTAYFTPDDSIEREDFYLLVSALEPYKRVDLAIAAIEEANKGRPSPARASGSPDRRPGTSGSGGSRSPVPSLRIAGTGSQLDALRRRASGRVEFLGRVADADLRDLYRRARGLIHPQREDFGIIAVEAQACGCPVVAFAAGGALETVTESTGVFFDEQTPAALARAIRRLEAEPRDPRACRANAERFSEEAFDRAIRGVVNEMLEIAGNR